MKQTLEGIIQQLDDELFTIKMQSTITIEISEKAIKTILLTLFKIKDQSIEYGFSSK
jgi:preprotein translocase subunit YajC